MKKKKTTLQDYYDFLDEILKDMLAGKDTSLRITAKMRRLKDKIDFLDTRNEFNEKLKIVSDNVVI